jgi:general stress protein 26
VNKERKKEAIELMENAEAAYVSSVDGEGYPNVKAMLTQKHEGIAVHYFSTNTSAKRTQRFLSDSKACVYFCHAVNGDYRGLMLVGNMEVLRDKRHREMLWHDGYEIYYPKGVGDEDYSVLKFTAFKGNYYHGLKNDSFTMEEFEKI